MELPIDFNELLIVILATNTNGISLNIPKSILSDTRYWYDLGNNRVYAEIHVYTNSIKMSSVSAYDVNKNGYNTVTSNSTLTVYYR